jgi:AcrR family transcriptional regulator
MSLREAGKQKRRDQILAAAEGLIRSRGDVGFSMRALAEKAGVALVTPFNLFESKGGVLSALVEERLDAQAKRMSSPPGDRGPVEHVLELARNASRTYTSDAALHRPLLRGLFQVEGVGHPALGKRSVQLWMPSLRDAAAAGMIAPDQDLAFLAHALHIAFRGALALWVSGEIDQEELERHAEHAASACLLGALTGVAQASVLERVGTLGRSRGAVRHETKRA